MEKNPLADLLGHIANLVEIVKQTSNSKLKSELPQDINQKVDDLEKAVNIYCEINNQALEESQKNLVPDQTMAMFESNSNLSKKDRKFLEKLMELKNEVRQAKKNLGIEIDKEDEPTKIQPEFIKKRDKKFKKLGADQKWKPL